MPGIFGVSDPSGESMDLLCSMRSAMHQYPFFVRDEMYALNSIAASRVHLGKIGQKQSPCIDRNGVSVWIEGEVYNLSKVIRRLGWQNLEADNSAFPIWLLYAYQVNQLDIFLNQIDGDFCAAIYDPRSNKVFNISDRYGMRLLYWYCRNGLFAWASEVKGLLAIKTVDRNIDPTAVNCFMDLGYFMGEHTWFNNIHLIKPATILEWDINHKRFRNGIIGVGMRLKSENSLLMKLLTSFMKLF